MYDRVKKYEEEIKIAKEDMILHNSEESRTNLHKLNREYVKFLKIEVSMLNQISQLN